MFVWPENSANISTFHCFVYFKKTLPNLIRFLGLPLWKVVFSAPDITTWLHFIILLLVFCESFLQHKGCKICLEDMKEAAGGYKNMDIMQLSENINTTFRKGV